MRVGFPMLVGTVFLILLPAYLSAGVCIPGLGCFSGVEGCEITTAWYNPGYLYTYHVAIEKNAIGMDFGERFPGTDRWGFFHYRLADNYLGIALNRKQYLGGYPFDTTYFRPRMSQSPDILPYMLDSMKPPSYLADFIISRKMFGGGAGINIHAGSSSNESEYDYFLTQSSIKAEPNSNSFGTIAGLDNKKIYFTAGFDYLSWNSDFRIIDTLIDTSFVQMTNSYYNANVNFQFKNWISQYRYFTFPSLSFNYDAGREEFSTRELGMTVNPENDRKKYSITAGAAFDDMGIPNSFSVGVNFFYSKTMNDFTVDTVWTGIASDTIRRSLPGKASIDEFTFPQIYISANFLIWKWLSAHASVDYSIKRISETIERSNVLFESGSYLVRKAEEKSSRYESDLSFELGGEITILEDLKINFTIDDMILYHSPYYISGDKNFVIVSKLTAWYQF